MLKRRMCSGVVAAVLMAALGGRAEAALVYATYAGTMTTGADTGGFFGPKGKSLVGAAVSIEYIIDDATVGATTQAIAPLASAIAGYNAADPVRAFVTVGGSTLVVAADQYGRVVSAGDASASPGAVHQAQGSTRAASMMAVQSYIAPDGGAWPWDYHTPFSYAVGPGDTAFGEISGWRRGVQTYLTFRPQSYTVSDVAPPTPPGLPEPAEWTLMLVGFGLAGVAARRRLRAAAA